MMASIEPIASRGGAEGGDDSTTTKSHDDRKACDKALNTAELLEMILLDVDDMKTVLLAQRVNKMFESTIRHSVWLRRKLWFEPDPDYFVKSPEISCEDETGFHIEGSNPLLFEIGKPPLFVHTERFGVEDRDPCVNTVSFQATTEQLTSKGEESWRRMYLTRFRGHETRVSFSHRLRHKRLLSACWSLCSFYSDKTTVQALFDSFIPEARRAHQDFFRCWNEECLRRDGTVASWCTGKCPYWVCKPSPSSS